MIVALGLAAVLFIKRMADLTESRLLPGDAEHGRHGGLPPEILIYDINGPLFFGARPKGAQGTAQRAQEHERADDQSVRAAFRRLQYHPRGHLLTPLAKAIDDAVIVRNLADHGWVVVSGFLQEPARRGLQRELTEQWEQGDFRRAGVGRGASWQLQPQLRGDRVRWIDGERCGPYLTGYLARMEQLRLSINRELLLGLFDFEAHLTVYPPGAQYVSHVDQFAEAPGRTVSVVGYLNAAWEPGDGGELRLYPPAQSPPVDVAPVGGTLVAFLSAELLHEVLPTHRERLSITGWFSRRG